jgi:hypothetical protein
MIFCDVGKVAYLDVQCVRREEPSDKIYFSFLFCFYVFIRTMTTQWHIELVPTVIDKQLSSKRLLIKYKLHSVNFLLVLECFLLYVQLT